jgi:trehalose-6-phosphate synthase
VSRLVIVSNRVGIPDGSARAGGLEVAIRPALKKSGGVWFGWSGKISEAAPKPAATVVKDNVSYVTVDLQKDDYEEFYNGFANRVLWPILHYRLDLAEFTRRDLGGYFRVNEFFANNLEKVLQPDDIVWVHDYHLMPLARALRERGHKNKIGFFIHIPFPPPEILTALPNHERLIPALGNYDLVGFQTDTDANNFSRYLSTEAGLKSIGPDSFDHAGRRIPGRRRDRAFRQTRASRRRYALCARCVRQLVGTRHDHRCRPARLQQGHSGPDECVRTVFDQLSGLARQRHLFANYPAQPFHHPGICRYRAAGGRGGRPH